MNVPRRCVVKIGSSSLTDPKTGALRETQIAFFVRELATCMDNGVQMLLVTSGAVAAGFAALGLRSRPTVLHEKQACAAIGQALLMHAYDRALRTQGRIGAQVLFNRSDFADRARMRLAEAVCDELLSRGVLPIINENDTTSVAELTFGDNDRLSALVACITKADRLVIATDTDGLYTVDPRTDVTAQKLSRISHIDAAIWNMAGASGSAVGTGGMRSKIGAAAVAMHSGIPVCIGRIAQEGDLWRTMTLQGDATVFDPRAHAQSTKQLWLRECAIVQGHVTIDAGAVRAVCTEHRSLLPAGVVAVSDGFDVGDLIEVRGPDGTPIGQGISNYAAWQLRAVAGCSTHDAMQRIDVARPEVIHRDDFVKN